MVLDNVGDRLRQQVGRRGEIVGIQHVWKPKPSGNGNGFQQPLEPHEHWHVDISYLNSAGTFFYLCSVLDGCSRFLLHWE